MATLHQIGASGALGAFGAFGALGAFGAFAAFGAFGDFGAFVAFGAFGAFGVFAPLAPLVPLVSFAPLAPLAPLVLLVPLVPLVPLVLLVPLHPVQAAYRSRIAPEQIHIVVWPGWRLRGPKNHGVCAHARQRGALRSCPGCVSPPDSARTDSHSFYCPGGAHAGQKCSGLGRGPNSLARVAACSGRWPKK